MGDDDRSKNDKKKEQNEVKKRMKEEAKKKKMEEKEKAKLRNDARYQKQKDLKERWNALEMEEAKRAEMILEEKTKIRIKVNETNRKMKEDEKIKKLAEKEAKRMMSENLARQQHEYKAKWYNQDKEALLEKEGKEKDANKRKQDDKDMKKLIQTEKESAVKTMSSPDSEALMQPAKTKRHQRDETKQASHPPEGDESDFVSAKDSSFTLRPHLSQQTMDDTLSITSLPTDTQQQLIDDHAKEVSTEDKTINHKSDNANVKSQTYAQSLDVFNDSNKLSSCTQ